MNVYFIRHAEPDYEHDTAAFLTEKLELPAQPVDWARELLWGSGSGDGKDRLSPWAHFNVDVTSVFKFYFGGGELEYRPAKHVYLNSQAHLQVK